MHITGWRIDCYLKGGRVTPQEGKEGTISGSIGVRCLPGGKMMRPQKPNHVSPFLEATSLPSSGDAQSSSEDGIRIRPALLSRPTDNGKDHCVYPGLNYQGGDLPDSQVHIKPRQWKSAN